VVGRFLDLQGVTGRRPDRSCVAGRDKNEHPARGSCQPCRGDLGPLSPGRLLARRGGPRSPDRRSAAGSPPRPSRPWRAWEPWRALGAALAAACPAQFGGSASMCPRAGSEPPASAISFRPSRGPSLPSANVMGPTARRHAGASWTLVETALAVGCVVGRVCRAGSARELLGGLLGAAEGLVRWCFLGGARRRGCCHVG